MKNCKAAHFTLVKVISHFQYKQAPSTNVDYPSILTFPSDKILTVDKLLAVLCPNSITVPEIGNMNMR